MSDSPSDFRIEIIKARPQAITSPSLGAPVTGEVVDITRRVLRDGLGTVNRALERDLLSFKTGDVMLSCRNADGFFDDLFAFFGTTDEWGLRIFRRGIVSMYGCIIGRGSITFDRKERLCGFTVYGVTKLLDMTSAANVKRTIAVTSLTSASGTSLNVNDTTGLMTGDTLHLTNGVVSEDVTIRTVNSATSITLVAAVVNSYASGSEVTCSTPFYRFKTIDWLAEQLFAEAGIGLSDLRIAGSSFNQSVPSSVNINGLDMAYLPLAAPVDKSGVRYQYTEASGPVAKNYHQSAADGDWTLDDTTTRPWVDASPYLQDGQDFHDVYGSTAYYLRAAQTPELWYSISASAGFGRSHPHAMGWHHDSGTSYCVSLMNNRSGGPPEIAPAKVCQDVTTDGLAWTNDFRTTDAPTGGELVADWPSACVEMNGIAFVTTAYVAYTGSTPSYRSYLVDFFLGIWTSILQADDTGTYRYYGFRWIPEKNYVLCMRGQSSTGPTFEICAFRETTRLWKRAFPACTVVADANTPGTAISAYSYPSQNCRMVNGRLCTIVMADGSLQYLTTDDEFLTYTMKKIVTPCSKGRFWGSRVNGQYAICAQKDTVPTAEMVTAPLYGALIEYADFDGLSVAEALKKLSVVSNALFFVDDDLQGHFVARDLYVASEVKDYRPLEQVDTLIWDQAVQNVKVSGNGFESTTGDDSFAAEGLSLDSTFIPNEAFCGAMSDAYYSFYSLGRKYSEISVHDADGRIFRPLDRLTLGDVDRWMVYESDHDLVADKVDLKLLEDI